LTEEHLQGIQTIQKAIHEKITEVMSLTKELDEAINRQDQVSVQILLFSRRQPIYELCSAWAEMKLKRYDLSDREAGEFDSILRGDQDVPLENKAALMQQLSNRRLLAKLQAMDKAANRKLCRDKSFYRTTLS